MGVTKVAALDLGFVATQVTPYPIFTLYRKGYKKYENDLDPDSHTYICLKTLFLSHRNFNLKGEKGCKGKREISTLSVSLYRQKTLIANYKKVVPQPHHFGTLDSI